MKILRWTDNEIDILMKNTTSSPVELQRLLPNRSPGAIKNKRTSLGIGPKGVASVGPWTKIEIAYIRNNPLLSTYAIAKTLNRSRSGVSSVRYSNGFVMEFYCVVCNHQLSQQGKYCRDHTWVGRQMRYYRERSSVNHKNGNLTEQNIFKLVTNPCYYCGKTGGGIDRFDNTKGYFLDNVVSCCTRCNTMKMSENFIDWLDQMLTVLKHHNYITKEK